MNKFVPFMHVMNCSCAPILQFFSVVSGGATVNRQIPNLIFGQFFTGFANYASIWKLVPPPVKGLNVLYNALNVSYCRR